MCQGNSGLPSLAGEDGVDRGGFGVGYLFVVVVGPVLDLADVDQLEEVDKLFPEHEENPVVLVLVPQALPVEGGNGVPKLGVGVGCSALPLLLPPGVPDLHQLPRPVEHAQLTNIVCTMV